MHPFQDVAPAVAVHRLWAAVRDSVISDRACWYKYGYPYAQCTCALQKILRLFL